MKPLEQASPAAGRLSLLIVSPSLNGRREQTERMQRRIESGVANQESPPIGIAYILATCAQAGHRVKFIDMVVDGMDVEGLLEYIAQEQPLLVGLSAYTIQIKSAGAIAAQIKRRLPEVKVCAGGCHATAMPIETLQEFGAFDFVFCGEAETSMPQVLKRLADGSSLEGIEGVVTRDSRRAEPFRVQDLDDLPFPAWAQFDLTQYDGTYPHRTRLELPMVTSRGCPFQCVFCAGALGKRRRCRTVGSVLAEMEYDIERFGATSIVFLDETFVLDMDWARRLFGEMIERGISRRIKWSCSTRVNNASPALFRLMRESGCYYVFFGLESGDEGMLKRMRKKITVPQIRQAVSWAKAEGLICVGSFIIGLPGETEETVRRSIDLAHELDLYSVTFPIAVPFPGTPLREMALRRECGLRILGEDWNDYGKQHPGVMESDDLPIERRRELQQQAYAEHPKKKLDEYIARLSAARTG